MDERVKYTSWDRPRTPCTSQEQKDKRTKPHIILASDCLTRHIVDSFENRKKRRALRTIRKLLLFSRFLFEGTYMVLLWSLPAPRTIYGCWIKSTTVFST